VLTLHAQAAPAGPVVHLADLVDGAPPALARLAVGPAPLPGHPLTWRRADLSAVLERHGVAAHWDGSAAVVVAVPATTLSRAELVQAALDAVQHQAWAAHAHLTAEVPETALDVPPQPYTLAVHVVPAPAPQMHVLVEIHQQGRIERMVPVKVVLADPDAISVGDRVVVAAVHGQVEITEPGEARGFALPGLPVPVHLASGRHVSGIARAGHKVIVEGDS
jgi:hypothetical protein